MIDTLNKLDTDLFLWLNSLHSEFFDKIMYFISYNTIFMLIIILILFSLSFKVYKKKIWSVLFFVLFSFGLSDSISSKVFKDNVKRLRPCHEPAIASQVHLAGENCWGGKYGFVSSHASNSFAIAFFFWLILKTHFSYIWMIFIHSGLVAYSRVYLGKHYPLDIICGAMLGMLISYFCFLLFKKTFLKRH